MSDADRPDRNDRRNSPEDTQPLRVVRPQDRQRWEPLPQGNEYESEATAFVQLPDGFTSGPYPGGYGYQGYPDPHGTGTPDAHGGVPGAVDHGGYAADPLAAPGHGYTPPSSFAPPTPGATTDPSATGQWTLPFADAPATDLPAHGLTDGGPHTGVPGGHYADGTDGASHALWPAAGTDGSSGTTGQWAIPTAPDEMLEESGEYLLGDDRTHPASGYGTAYGPYDHGHGHGHAPVDPAATGQWHFTTDQHTTDQHTGAGHLPYGQQPHRPADQVTPGYDPGHHVPASGDSAGGTLGGAGNWSLPADALAQWPPRAEPVDDPQGETPGHDDAPAHGGAPGHEGAPVQGEVAPHGDGLPQQEAEPGPELKPEPVPVSVPVSEPEPGETSARPPRSPCPARSPSARLPPTSTDRPWTRAGRLLPGLVRTPRPPGTHTLVRTSGLVRTRRLVRTRPPPEPRRTPPPKQASSPVPPRQPTPVPPRTRPRPPTLSPPPPRRPGRRRLPRPRPRKPGPEPTRSTEPHPHPHPQPHPHPARRLRPRRPSRSRPSRPSPSAKPPPTPRRPLPPTPPTCSRNRPPPRSPQPPRTPPPPPRSPSPWPKSRPQPRNRHPPQKPPRSRPTTRP
ncbi:hypothetical protein ACEXOX_19435 [Streptomyces sp. Ac-502]